MAGSIDGGSAAICRRLDIVISLLLEGERNRDATITDKIVRLADVGLADTEIATIIGRPRNYVSSIRSQLKARKPRGKA